MMQNAVVDEINRIIGPRYSNPYGKPLFRVVFSDEQKEKRRGIFNYFSGDIFVRSQYGVEEVPKYPWIRSKWILERWAGPEHTFHPDLVQSNEGDYICIYTFQDPNGNYLPPLLKVAEIIIKFSLHPRDKAKALQEDREKEMKEDQMEEEKIYENIRANYENTATEAENTQIGYTGKEME